MKPLNDTITKSILNEMLITNLCEMRMAPDQSGYPLTRRQVEKLLAQYERREDEDNWNDDPEYRSPEGWKRASWFPPEVDSNHAPEDLDNAGKQRPAKLMPYDYFYTVHHDSEKDITPASDLTDEDDTEHKSDEQNWSGATNPWK